MNKQIEYLVKIRDAAQMFAEATNEYIDSLAPKEIKIDQAAPEEVFNCLTYEAQQGQKLGNYETASQDTNDQAKFKAAYDTLEKADANIKDRYHGQDYAYTYWIYGQNRIYRQRRTTKQ